MGTSLSSSTDRLTGQDTARTICRLPGSEKAGLSKVLLEKKGKSMALAKEQQARAKKLYVYSDNCSGCGYCQLACSFVKTGTFGLGDSLINIRRVDGKERFRVGFLENCDRCGFCARYCFFGVLSEVKER